jgi:TetR/AcrR family transcriptional regulator, transcriptional repressor for nem operon
MYAPTRGITDAPQQGRPHQAARRRARRDPRQGLRGHLGRRALPGRGRDLGVAAAAHFGEMAETIFAQAPYRSLDDPLARVLGYVDFRREILTGELPKYTCLLGTMVQETYATHPAIRAACEREIVGHAVTLESDIAAAFDAAGKGGEWTPRSLALHIQAVIQGAFVLAKATGGAQVAADSLVHLRRYLTLLLETDKQREARS